MKIASHAETETMAAVYATHFGVVSRRLDGQPPGSRYGEALRFRPPRRVSKGGLVRRTLILALVVCVLVLAALAALATPTALAAERMWVGFHDDPSFRWVNDRGRSDPFRGAERLVDRAPARGLDHGSADAASERERPVRSRVLVRRHRRGGQERAGERPRGGHVHLRHAEVGERRPDAERRAEADVGLPGVRARDRLSVLGPERRASRSSASGRCGTSRI